MLMSEENIDKHALKVRSLIDENIHLELFNLLAEFGVRNPETELAFQGSFDDVMIKDLKHITYSQVYHGIPVFGTHINVHVDASGNVLGINGIYDAMINISTTPKLTNENALFIAQTFAKTEGAPLCSLEGLYIYSGSISTSERQDFLAYIALCGDLLQAPRYQVVVDANNGRIITSANLRSSISRTVKIGDPKGNIIFKDGDAVPDNAVIKNLLTFSQTFYDAFKNLKWIGLDNKDSAIDFTVDVKAGTPAGTDAKCPNAFNQGLVNVFCEGFVREDVTYHELMHGVTHFAAGLAHGGESGALNEAVSDIVAETIEILKNGPNDPNGFKVQPLDLDCNTLLTVKRWVLSGDQPNRIARYMRNPFCVKDPRTTAQIPPFQCDRDPQANDNGGVHINAGVIDQMYTLLVDGGKLNKDAPMVTGIDIVKAFNIIVHSILGKLVSGKVTLPAAAGGFRSSCKFLIGKVIKNPLTGADGPKIAQADCDQLENAMKAVKLEGPICAVVPPNKFVPGKIDDVFITFAPVPQGEIETSVVGDWPTAPKCIFVDTAGNRLTTDGLYEGREFGNTIKCPVPVGAKPGEYSLKIVDSLQVERDAPEKITIYAQPNVLSLDPKAGEPPLDVTIKGTGFQEFEGCGEITKDFFDEDLDCLTCFWGTTTDGIEVAATFVDANTIKCRVPELSAFDSETNPIPLRVALNYFTPVNTGLSFRDGEPIPAPTPMPSNFLVPPVSASVPRLFRRKH